MLSEDSSMHFVQFTVGWVEYDRRQPALLGQVYEFATASMKSRPSDMTGGGKPKSRPPFDMGVLDLHDRCRRVLIEAEFERDSPIEFDGTELNELYHKARRLLGYDAPVMLLPAVVCHQCGGPLIVASDCKSSVTCAERCGVEYPTHTWLELLTTRMEA